ncbi:hypothetical protein GOODEAATRI_020657 [Goodea atripinnis]|uniref:Uncharacterized protein n=1 Tax=Goodea atripinnis TaxID=208336 RepID=A0ABV0PFS3_9TELE
MQSWDVFFHSADLSNPRNGHTFSFYLKGVSAVALTEDCTFSAGSPFVCFGGLRAKKGLIDRRRAWCGLQAVGVGFSTALRRQAAERTTSANLLLLHNNNTGREEEGQTGGDVQKVFRVEIWTHTAVK